MKVLMFGWEYPPHISGGLGTACFGLTKALTEKEVAIDFVVPCLYGDEPSNGAEIMAANKVVNTLSEKQIEHLEENISFFHIDSSILPYENEEDYNRRMKERNALAESKINQTNSKILTTVSKDITRSFCVELKGGYGKDLYEEVNRYAFVAGSIAKQREFDVIHAHDWLCFKAGEVAKKISGKPLIVHVHATEYDRSGENVNERVYELERQGMEAADLIVCVSEYTRNTVISKYFQPQHKVICVHNGVISQSTNTIRMQNVFDKKIVSFIGRITFQKGPDYFVEAAERVLKKDDGFVFVIAGSGDMEEKMIRLVARKKISRNFFFTGFLEGEELKELLSISSAFVMPSVSEPFGIAPLEAIQAGVPTIISRQSGVSEVLNHAIKVDFWDVDSMADAIYSIGKHKALSDFLSRQGKLEAISITWDKAAEKLKELYNELVEKNR